MKRASCLLGIVLFVLISLNGCGGGGSGGGGGNDDGQNLSAEKAITAFSVLSPSSEGVIDEVSKFIAVVVPQGTDLTALIALFETTGVSVEVGDVVQQSATTENDFTDRLSYIVTAEDGSTETYIVLVTVQNYVRLESDPGDYIGYGNTYNYTQEDSLMGASATGGLFSIEIDGDKQWTGYFQAPDSISILEPGSYENLTRYLFHDPAVGGLDWTGDGRGCNNLSGSFVIDNVLYKNGNLAEIDLFFEQHCENDLAALHGQIHWTAYDDSVPPGPVEPPPADLWEPAAGATPAAGNYVYLESESGDFIGQGLNYIYTLGDSYIVPSSTDGLFTLNVTGDQYWTGEFKAMDSLSQLEPGYYGNLQRYPFHNPVRGGLSWSGEGRGCNTLMGWFVVDNILYSNGTLSEVDLRFEQHCDGAVSSLHGQVHWTADDNTTPAGPVNPPPADLWEPAAGATPATGNYVYLESESGDFIGQGQTYTYTSGDSNLVSSSADGLFTLNVTGAQYWTGQFQAMDSLSQLEPGYYGNLQRYPFHNPVRGGLSWSGEGRGCNTLTGWFVVDNVLYSNGTLSEVDLRFEQHCDGISPSLHGQIHWSK